MNFSKLYKSLSVLIISLIAITGCNTTNSGNSGPTDVAVTMQVQTSSSKFKTMSVDSLTEVKLLVEELELESASEDSLDFEAEDLVVNIPLDGSELELTSRQLSNGIYDEFEMEIENDDDGQQVSDTSFYNNGETYSIVVSGVYNGEDFTYKVDEDFEIEMELNPVIEITDNTKSAAVAINFDPTEWFVDNSGNPLDPKDPSNDEIIEENIKNSFEAEGEEDEEDDDNDSDDDDDDDNDD